MQNNLINGFNFNANTNKMDSDWQSVTEQAGIYAGDKGFDINVAGNTDLKGAVIDSTATADKNTLNTGTITFSDIENKAEYDTKGYGASYDSVKTEDKNAKLGEKGFIPNIPMASGDKAESTTKSAIADGTIIVRDKDKQKQDINDLRRNTQNTLNQLDKIFDKDKIEEKQEMAGLFSELAFNAIHNLSQKKVIDENGKEKIVSTWTEDQKVMAHALVGYVSGELAGSKSSFSNAMVAGINKFVVEEIMKDDKKRKYYLKHPEQLQWISAAVGAVAGSMVSGDATSGASIAAKGTKDNLFAQYFINMDNVDLSKLKDGEASVVGYTVDITMPIKALVATLTGNPEILAIPVSINFTDTVGVFNDADKTKFSSWSLTFGGSVLPVSGVAGTGHLETPQGQIVTNSDDIRNQMSAGIVSLDTSIGALLGVSTSINKNEYKFILEHVLSDFAIGVGIGGTQILD